VIYAAKRRMLATNGSIGPSTAAMIGTTNRGYGSNERRRENGLRPVHILQYASQ
jgi:hypothetical protein